MVISPGGSQRKGGLGGPCHGEACVWQGRVVLFFLKTQTHTQQGCGDSLQSCCSDFRLSRDCDTKVKPLTSASGITFSPSFSPRFRYYNALQLPDFHWLRSDLRWPPCRGWQYNKRKGVLKWRNSISTLLAIQIPARPGRGFIIGFPLSLLSWELTYSVYVCVCLCELNV